jgi:hypothetical protein
MKALDLVGKKFNRLLVVKKAGRKNYKVMWECVCDCGNTTFVNTFYLINSKIRSCGCLNQESCSQLQLKVEDYISKNDNCDRIKHEYNCDLIAINPKTDRQLPYDNEVVLNNGAKLIVEVMGESHYKIDLLTIKNAKRRNITPEQTLKDLQWRDEYKKQYAVSQGYHYLAIPYWTESDDSYQTLIDQKIQEILITQNE